MLQIKHFGSGAKIKHNLAEITEELLASFWPNYDCATACLAQRLLRPLKKVKIRTPNAIPTVAETKVKIQSRL